jgi:hypothetical protein
MNAGVPKTQKLGLRLLWREKQELRFKLCRILSRQIDAKIE